MAKPIEKGRIGSSFDDFLKDEGIYEECSTAALKRVLAAQIARAMAEEQLSKSGPLSRRPSLPRRGAG